ncbi:MAG TPA: hypothetical protein VJK07_01050 [Candidatus Nanoarchaeia archaeon]|nr:hypothetical protein [Candidatus Nanoarchaeia archaeon]
MEYKRTQIELKRHPGRAACALDAFQNRMAGKPRQYSFDGVVGRNGYSINQAVSNQHARPVRLAVRDVNDNGTIPSEVYTHLVEALRTLHDSPEKHPVLIRYDSGLDIIAWDLELRVGDAEFIERRKAA